MNRQAKALAVQEGESEKGRRTSDDQRNGLEQVWENDREKVSQDFADQKSAAQTAQDKLSSELDQLRSMMKADRECHYVQTALHMQV